MGKFLGGDLLLFERGLQTLFRAEYLAEKLPELVDQTQDIISLDQAANVARSISESSMRATAAPDFQRARAKAGDISLT